jgi:hypothetical protein
MIILVLKLKLFDPFTAISLDIDERDPNGPYVSACSYTKLKQRSGDSRGCIPATDNRKPHVEP